MWVSTSTAIPKLVFPIFDTGSNQIEANLHEECRQKYESKGECVM